jgi:hypothetical protein
MIFVIILLIVVFLWWSLTKPKNQMQTIPSPYVSSTSKNPKQKFKEYILKLMSNTIVENRKAVRNLNKFDQVAYSLKSLEACKDHFIEMAFDYSLKYDIPTDEVKAIVEDCYDKSMQTIKF